MRKIKITLASGNTIEKPLITAFKGTYGDYVVLDNETVGSMGLPVILISKVQDSNISTIADANEWNAVKENLRNIIAGNQIIKINVLDAYSGADVYYKQLTLPVASFDALKATGDSGEQPVVEATPVEPVAPVMPEAPVSMETNIGPVPEAAPVEPTPVPVEPVAPVMPDAPVSMGTNIGPVPEAAPVEPTPVPVEPVTPVMPEAPLNMDTTVSQSPAVAPIPDVNEQAQTQVDLSSEKEAFLKACENMFDALVAKFNK